MHIYIYRYIYIWYLLFIYGGHSSTFQAPTWRQVKNTFIDVPRRNLPFEKGISAEDGGDPRHAYIFVYIPSGKLT
jgi:hypothetical protein